MFVEVVLVSSWQRSHTSDLNSDLLTSLVSNFHDYMALDRSRALINTHQPLVALVNLRLVNYARPLEFGWLYCK